MTITNQDTYIDSRDIIDRIEHLTQLRNAGPVDLGDEDNAADQDSLFHELATLEALAVQGRDYIADWEYGEQLIRHDAFIDHARELAEDVGYIKNDADWPYRHIDWHEAADELKQDYVELDFDGVTYYAR